MNANPKDAPADAVQAIKGLIGRGKASTPAAQTSKEDTATEPDVGPEQQDDTPPTSDAKPPTKPSRGKQSASDDSEDEPIPPHRFNKVNERLKAREAELTAARAELASLRKQQVPNDDAMLSKLEKSKPDGFDDWDAPRQTAWVSRHVAEEVTKDKDGWMQPYLKAAATQLRMQKETGQSLDASQADAVAEVLDELPRLTASEALLVATHRHAELFAQEGGKKKLPTSHSVQDPSKGGRPESAPRDDRGRFLKEVATASHASARTLAVDFIKKGLAKRT